MSKLKEIVSSNTILYSAWFYLYRVYRGDKVRLPNNKDSLYIDGYPRSGNTYTAGYIRNAIPTCSFASHLHTVAGIKIANNKGLPIFIIIRNPEDAILSNLFRVVMTKKQEVSTKLINRLAMQYLIFYKFVQKHSSDITVFKFEDVIDNEKMVLDTVLNKLGLPLLADDEFEQFLTIYKNNLKKREHQKDDAASSLPNKNREEFKNLHRSNVVDTSCFKDCKELYENFSNY